MLRWFISRCRRCDSADSSGHPNGIIKTNADTNVYVIIKTNADTNVYVIAKTNADTNVYVIANGITVSGTNAEPNTNGYTSDDTAHDLRGREQSDRTGV